MQNVGSYELLELVGRGASSRVYRARDSRDGREVALKLLVHPESEKPRLTLRFRREFRAVKRLEHPSIVRVFEQGENGHLWIAMEFVEGRSFLQALDGEVGRPLQPQGLPMLVALLAQVLEALAYLHTRQVLHRDLKPENILVDRQGRAKLVDFGLARLEDVTTERLTQTGVLLGTPLYVAPEQALGAMLDGRTDLYSLGAIAYEALAGKPPFEGRTVPELLLKRLSDAAPALSSSLPSVPSGLERFVHRLLEADPEERYSSAAEALEALTTAETALSASSVTLTADRPLLRPRLVGRAEELAAFRSAFSLAGQGQPRLLLVEGEAGLGKSRLLQELRHAVRLEGAFLLQGAAFEGASVPFAAFDGVLSRLAEMLGDERGGEARRATRPLAPALRRVCQAFESVPGWETVEAVGDPEPDEAKRHVFEAVSRLLEHLSCEVPVVLIIDDFHLCDGLSVELVEHLHARLVKGARAEGCRLLMAIGLRPEECRAQEKMASWLEAVSQEQTSVSVVLAPLDGKQAAQLLASMLGERRERHEEGVVLHRLTDGNPFFIEETIRSHHAAGQIRFVAEGWSVRLAAPGRPASGELMTEELAIPEKVRTTLRRRLRSLPEAQLALLEKASVLGREFDVAQLGKLSGDSVDVLLDGLDLLLRGGFLLETRQGSDRLRFRHDLLREVVYAGLSGLKRRRLHGRAAEVWSRETGDDALVARAHHAARANDVETALEALPRAAERLMGLYDLDGALRLLLHFLELEATLAPEARRALLSERHAVLARVSSLQAKAGKSEESEATARLLLESALEAGDRAAESDARLGLAEALRQQTQLERALEQADGALEAALAAGDRSREVASRIQRGRDLAHLTRFKEAAAELRRAERLAGRLGSDVERLEALQFLAFFTDDGSGPRRTIARHQRCAELAQKLGRKEALLGIWRRIAIQLVRLGDVAAARGYFQRSRELGLEIGDRRWAASMLYELGCCDHQLGRLSDAEAQYRQGLGALVDLGEFQRTITAVISLSDVLIEGGRYDESREVLEHLLADPRLARFKREACYPVANLAQVEIPRGQYVQALEHLQVAMEVTEELGRADVLGWLHESLGRLFVAVGAFGRAAEFIARASQLYRRTQLRGVAAARVLRGSLLLEQGRARSAERAFQSAAALCDKGRFVIEGLAARVGRARSLAARDSLAAYDAASECYEETRRRGLRPLAAEAALVLVATAPPAEAQRHLVEALELALVMGAPPLLLRLHAKALEAGLGDREEHLHGGRRALAAIEPNLGEFRESFMDRPEVRRLSSKPDGDCP